MSEKERISVSVDAVLASAGRDAVRRGQVSSFSAWVNASLARQLEHDQRLQALDTMIAEYEAEHGVITEEEMEEADRRLRARAIHVGRPTVAGVA